jgi:pimeloyl-ACP methyl ester carboxylesterase
MWDRVDDSAGKAADGRTRPSAEDWFAGGERIGFDPETGVLSDGPEAPLGIYVRREGDIGHVVTFLPGYPDGSFGWSKVHAFLPDAAAMPKLFFDYVGMGDSDKPRAFAYSTAERADLIEAIWRGLSVRSTTLVAFDFSSLVVLEHLRRRLERAERGEPPGGPRIRGVFIFNGGLFTDGHTHPWYTTPLLRRLPKRAWPRVGASFPQFRMMTRVMWSKGYGLSESEVREIYNAVTRRNGGFYLAAAAGFVADHKRQGKRLDFAPLFKAYRNDFPFVVGGSDEDPFEHRQVKLAKRRLGKLGLQIKRLPGGHLTTSEQPQALAALIAGFERGVPATPFEGPETPSSGIKNRS